MLMTISNRATLLTIQHTLTQRRWNLVASIKTIYPIQQLDGKSLFINGFRLPNSEFTGMQQPLTVQLIIIPQRTRDNQSFSHVGCDEEQIATALGYVTHILYLVSKYLDVSMIAVSLSHLLNYHRYLFVTL
jgi:hypothetical protein